MRGMMRLDVVLGVALVASYGFAVIDPPASPSAQGRMTILLPGLSVQLVESCINPPNLRSCAPQFSDGLSFVQAPGRDSKELVDALGYQYLYGAQPLTSADCGPIGQPNNTPLARFHPTYGYETILLVNGACEDGFALTSDLTIWQWDSVTGTALMTVRSQKYDDSGSGTEYSGWLQEVFRVSGFPTLFDVVATFEPSGPNLSWNVPPMPEAFPGPVDGFDVLVGDLEPPRVLRRLS